MQNIQVEEFKNKLAETEREITDLERQQIIAENQLQEYKGKIIELFGTSDLNDLVKIRETLVQELNEKIKELNE